MKSEVRVLGIDDGPFTRFQEKDLLVVAAMFRGGSFMDGLLSCNVEKDGSDATEKIISMIKKSKFKNIRCIFLDGIAVGGFNVIDVIQLHNTLHIPVIVVIRKIPDYDGIFRVLDRMGKKKEIQMLKDLPEPKKINDIYIQNIGLSTKQALEFLNLTCTHSHVPEPLRIAHIIAGGVVDGESRGRS